MYKVIIVDDEPLTRGFLKVNIPKINCDCEVISEAMEGTEALEALEREMADIIITDIRMPVMDGLELCSIVSKKYPSIKLIILSGYDEFEYAKKAIKYGVSEYLVKPLVLEDLKSALHKATAEIEEKKAKENSFKSLQEQTLHSKKHIIKNRLKALITNSKLEANSVYESIEGSELNIIKDYANIIILKPDEEVSLLRNSHPEKLSEVKLSMYRLTEELIEKQALGNVFLDNDENAVVLLTKDDGEDFTEVIKDLQRPVSLYLKENFNLTATLLVGTPFKFITEIGQSYNNAVKSSVCHLLHGGNAVYGYGDYINNKGSFKKLNSIVSSIQSGLLNSDEIVYSVSLRDFVDFIGDFSYISLYRYGIFLIISLSKLNQDLSPEDIAKAYEILTDVSEMERSKLIYLNKFTAIIRHFNFVLMQSQRERSEQSIIEKAKEYIIFNYSEPISLDEVAERLGVTASYLSNIFHKNIGEPYIKFLTRIRMEQAKKLLLSDKNVKVFDVSKQVGYVSVKHFLSVFKKHFNVSPGEFQKMNK